MEIEKDLLIESLEKTVEDNLELIEALENALKTYDKQSISQEAVIKTQKGLIDVVTEDRNILRTKIKLRDSLGE